MRNILLNTFLILTLSISQPCFGMTKILILGDSLCEGMGVSSEEAWPSLYQEQNPNFKIINSSISGSTSAGALARLKWTIKQKPQILFLALGANDGLRAHSTQSIYTNLKKTIQYAQDKKVRVVLFGMMMPPNYGEPYLSDFKNIFSQLNKDFTLDFYPFLLKDVGGVKKYTQSDGMHPNKLGHQIIAKNISLFTKNLSL
ncbi:MAG: arylesterase [Candidatus Cloacimonetes bacterium]|nr:arylesterase [Candidatus Cloacimonadota bacterium]